MTWCFRFEILGDIIAAYEALSEEALSSNFSKRIIMIIMIEWIGHASGNAQYTH